MNTSRATPNDTRAHTRMHSCTRTCIRNDYVNISLKQNRINAAAPFIYDCATLCPLASDHLRLMSGHSTLFHVFHIL